MQARTLHALTYLCCFGLVTPKQVWGQLPNLKLRDKHLGMHPQKGKERGRTRAYTCSESLSRRQLMCQEQADSLRTC